MDDQNTLKAARKANELDTKPIVSHDPYNGKEVASYPQDNDAFIETLINNAEKTFQSWRMSSLEFRADIMLAVATDIRSNKNHLSQLMAQEMGKPIEQGKAEIEKCAKLCEYYAAYAPQHLADELIETDAQQSFVSYDPLGVVLGIMPWNYPFWQAFRFMVPTLMAGNVTLLKHSSLTIGCAMEIQEIFTRNGLPMYAASTLKISSSRMDQVVKHKLVRAVSLTGSEGAGSHVASLAAKHIKPTLLELGGSNPFIVLDDADLDKAVDAAIQGRFQNTGQSCIAAKRIFLQNGIYDQFLDRFVSRVKELRMGNPLKEETYIGPMASESLAEELEKQMQDSIDAGAKMQCGGDRDGAMFTPTVLAEVRAGMPAFDEELFGPVASIIRVSTLMEAIELGNKSEFGLGVAVFTSNPEEVLKRTGDFQDGALFINSIVKSDPKLPFGGTKKSGYGRELSQEGIRAFVNKKTVYVAK